MVVQRRGANVTAVVLSYNSLGTLRDVIAGVLAGTVVPGRVIVVDNASTDGTRTWLAGGLPAPVEALLMTENVGVGAGHTAGWHRALEDPSCGWVWSLEHDTIPTPDVLARILTSAESYPPERLGLVRPRTYRDEQQMRELVHAYPPPAPPSELIESTFTSFNGPLIPRRVIEQHGELRDDFFVCFEDRDFSRRLRAAGLQIMVDPSAIVWHEWSRRRLGGSVARSYYSTRNSFYWQRYVTHRSHVRLRAMYWELGSYARTLLLNDRKLDRLRARRHAVRDGLRGDLGRKDYGFLAR